MSDGAICRFVIVGCQRSGTTVTREAVLGHPQVSMLREELSVSPLFSEGMRAFTHGREPYPERRRANLALFDAFANLYVTPQTKAVGVKIALNSPEAAADLRNFLYEFVPDVRVIHVVREDLVAQFASLKRAVQTGVWDVRGDVKAGGEDRAVSLPENAFKDYAEQALAITAQLRRIAVDSSVMEVVYERDIDCAKPVWTSVFEFLGLDLLEPHWMVMKKVSPPIENYVQNVSNLRGLAESAVARQSASPDDLALERLGDAARSDTPAVLARRYAWMRNTARRDAASVIGRVLVATEPRATEPHKLIDQLLIALVASCESFFESGVAGGCPGWWQSVVDRGNGDRRRALREAMAGLELVPTGQLLDLARLAGELEDWTAADVVCELALAQLPSRPYLSQALFELLAMVLEQAQDGVRARELVQRFEIDYADSAAFAVFEARATLPVDPARARLALERAVSIDSRYSYLLQHIAKA